MQADEVPDELVTAAWRAIRASRYVFTEEAMRVVLAATLELHERQVRERIAAELRVAPKPEPGDIYGPAWHNGYADGMERAARMVEGGGEKARPLATGGLIPAPGEGDLLPFAPGGCTFPAPADSVVVGFGEGVVIVPRDTPIPDHLLIAMNDGGRVERVEDGGEEARGG